jgi:hypothetical protein
MKLSLNALKERAGKVVTTELLGTINGGINDRCHTLVITYVGPAK